VNDAVLGMPGVRSYFYDNNQGSATVTVKRTR
jgi:hypothetical protein